MKEHTMEAHMVQGSSKSVTSGRGGYRGRGYFCRRGGRGGDNRPLLLLIVEK